jgi:hypothetical protein
MSVETFCEDDILTAFHISNYILGQGKMLNKL